MVAAVIILTLICIFNIIMWSVFISRFNRYFSTDEIMEKTRDNLNLMLIDLNNNANRNINLLQGKIDELKAISKEADESVKILERKLEEERTKLFLKSNSGLSSYDTAHSEDEGSIENNKGTKVSSRKSSRSETETSQKSAGTVKTDRNEKKEKSEKSRKTENSAKTGRKKPAEQEIPVETPPVTSRKRTAQKKTDDIPEYYVASDPIVPKKSFNQKVKDLSEMGFTPEQIASKLGCAIQEVKFSLEFS